MSTNSEHEVGGWTHESAHSHDATRACNPGCPAYANLQREKRRAARAAGGPLTQHPDGSWVPAEPLPWMGWKARVEQWFRRHGFARLASLMGAWDERGLGR